MTFHHSLNLDGSLFSRKYFLVTLVIVVRTASSLIMRTLTDDVDSGAT
jgi:hypothetical protein